MALEKIYTANGVEDDFNIVFSYLENVDVSVAVEPSGGSYDVKTLDTHYTISGDVVTFKPDQIPPNNSKVRVRRSTQTSQPRHTYYAGSSVTADSLNTNYKQILYALEEFKELNAATLQVDVTANSIGLGHMADNSVGTDQYVDNSIEHVHLKNDIIDGDNIQNDVINSEHYAADSIDAEHYAPGSVDTTAIATNAVTVNELADNAVDTNAIVNNAVTADKLATNITGLNPIGTVIWYAGNTAPSGYLKANGDAIANGSGTTQSITANFSALYAIVGANLPDLRGEFIRGWDDGKGTDSGRTIRSAQTDDFKSHQHTSDGARFGSNSTHPGANFYSSAGDNSGHNPINSVNATGGTETRPRNIALLACIKY